VLRTKLKTRRLVILLTNSVISQPRSIEKTRSKSVTPPPMQVAKAAEESPADEEAASKPNILKNLLEVAQGKLHYLSMMWSRQHLGDCKAFGWNGSFGNTSLLGI
jgi:hypothetical protein